VARLGEGPAWRGSGRAGAQATMGDRSEEAAGS
jgi:hypothetical protein